MQVCTMNVFQGLENIALAVTFVTCVVGASQLKGRCPPYWNQFEGFCYRYFSYHLVWVDAEIFCQNLSNAPPLFWSGNAHLVCIHSQEEQDFVHGQFLQYHNFSTRPQRRLKGIPDGMWIGLTDREQENLWSFTDGKRADFTNWQWGEPNGATQDEDAAALWYDPDPTQSKWYDVPMNKSEWTYPFICKIPASCCLI